MRKQDYYSNLRGKLMVYLAKDTEKKARERFSEKADISIETLNSYLKVVPNKATYENIAKMAKVMGESPDYLCGFYEEEIGNGQKRENTALAHLKSLVNILNDTILDFSIEESEDELVIRCQNKRIIKMFQDAKQNNSDKSDSFVTLWGKMFSAPEYWNFKMNLYLYSHLIDLVNGTHTIEDYIKEVDKKLSADINNDEEYQLKVQEWEETGGNPNKYISDEYYDIFLSNK